MTAPAALNGPMPPALDQWFHEFRRRSATALHLSAGSPPMLRVSGDLVPWTEGATALQSSELQAMMEGLLSPEHRARFHAEGTLDLAFSLGERGRFVGRYSCRATGPGAVFRAIPGRIAAAASLGIPPAVVQLSDLASGLVVLTGPQASGKTTTIAALTDQINRTRAAHVITIDDAVDLVHIPLMSLITQRVVGRHVPDIETALVNASRESPDVVVISAELERAAAIRRAAHLAQSGTLVLVEVRGRSVTSALARLIAAFGDEGRPEANALLGRSLAAVVAQRLPSREPGALPYFDLLMATSAVRASISAGDAIDPAEITRVRA
jgi:twitching motility protein PilT